MKRRFCMLISFALLSFLLCSCGSGRTDNVKISIGNSTVYTVEEIESAMQTVTDYFQKEFIGCTLTELYYDESNYQVINNWEETYPETEVIILYSTFDVDAKGGDGSFDPNSTYYKWQWILTRSDGETWDLRNYGY